MPTYRDSDSSIVEAYDKLDEGKTLKMWFESESKFLSFRSMLYLYKSRTEEFLFMADPDKKKRTLSIVCVEKGAGGCIYKLSMKDKLPRLQYKIEIIEEESVTPQDEAAE